MATDVIRALHRSFGTKAGAMAPQWVVNKYQRWTTDVYVVSFPKSGRTWFRTILGTVLQLRFGTDAVDPSSIHHMWKLDRRVPRITFTHDMNAHLISSERVSWSGNLYSGKKTILLVRDPRDTIVSLYYEMTKRVHAYEGTIESFISQDSGGIASLVAFLNDWCRNRERLSRLHLICYEDIHASPLPTIAGALEFAGITGTPDAIIEQAIERCSLDAMRRMELSGAVPHVRLRPGDASDPESYKVRKGKVGGYAETLSAADCDFLDKYIYDHLDEGFARYRLPPCDGARGSDAAA